MTIPPVSVRQVRPCEVCGLYQHNNGYAPGCDYGDYQSRLNFCRDKRKKIPPCVNNFTESELIEIFKEQYDASLHVENYK